MEPEPPPAPQGQRPPLRTTRLALRLFAVIALPACVVYAGISLYSADVLTRSHNRPPTVDPLRVGSDAVPWSVRTADGLTLRGWYFPSVGDRPLVVLVHGMGGSWGKMAWLGRDLHALGYGLLLFDLRGHGQSDPSRLFMGSREREDLRAVLAWAGREGFSPDRVGWVGQSLGASTVLMEGERNADIRVAVADSPFGDLPVLLDTQLTRHSRLPRLFNPGILFAAHRVYGVRTDNLIPIRSARSWTDRPLLLIHGEADTIVPVGQSKALALAAGPACRAITLPGVEHTGAYRSNPKAYVEAVDRFLTRHLRQGNAPSVTRARSPNSPEPL